MTTTELIKILQDNETGAISLKPREISLTINGRYMPNPQITLSSTGDGICGAEIDLDVCGEWLEQEPSGDAINRQAVLDEISDYNNDLDYTTNELYDRIKRMPSVNPQEPKTGHWIAVENEEMKTVGYYCSECDLPMETEKRTDLCPNCGAKMKGDTE